MRLFQAPNNHFKAANRYSALINARVSTKRSTYRKKQQDAQFLF